MTSPSAEFEAYLKAASRASSQVKLVEVAFIALEARLTMPLPTEETGKLSWDLHRCDGRWLRSEENDLRVLLPYVVDISAKKRDSTTPVAHLAVTMRAIYELKDPAIDDATLQGFAAISPFMHTWPYLRAEIQSLTTKLDLPPLLLPVVVSGNAEEKVRMVRTEPPRRGAPSKADAARKPRRPKAQAR